ncbi:O-antigen ligase family protein [Mycoplasmatota bacterium WC44]
MKSIKLPYLIQTVLIVVLLAVTPLLYSADYGTFHRIKLQTIYLVVTLIFLVSIFCFKCFKDEYIDSFKIFKTERKLLLTAIFFMFCSLFQNISQMNWFVRNGHSNGVFWGARPNYLSIFFYIIAIIFIMTSIPSVKHVYRRIINISVIVSLVIVGSVILYQIFVNDFIGVGRSELFGFGNSNYTPDAFAIIGLLLLVPLMFKDKINIINTLIGVFLFVIVLLSLSRAAFIGLFISLLVTLIILIKNKHLKWIRVLILGVSASLAVIGLVYITKVLGSEALLNDFKTLYDLISGQASAGELSSLRTDLWVAAIDELTRNPLTILFGNGQSVFIWQHGAESYLVTNVHNQYVDILLSGGIVVFGIFMYLLIKQFTYASRLVKSDITNISLLAALIFITTKWMFNSLNAIHSPFVLIVFILISYRYMEIKRIESN